MNCDSDGFRVLVPLIIGTQVLLDPCTFETVVADQKRKKKLLLLKELIASTLKSESNSGIQYVQMIIAALTVTISPFKSMTSPELDVTSAFRGRSGSIQVSRVFSGIPAIFAKQLVLL